MATRVRGQEAVLTMTEGGNPLDTFDRGKTWEVDFKREILEEHYWGFVSPEYDSISNGVEGNFEIDINEESYPAFLRNTENKAQRRGANVLYNVMCIMNHPSGKKVRFVFPNVEFGDIKPKQDARKPYVPLAIPFRCSTWRTIA